nr:DUF5677 domain-containing protein [uncultured Rhodopila sp.]
MSELQQEADYTILQKLMLNLVQSQSGRPINIRDSWLNDAQTIARKMFEHLASLRALTDVHRVEINETQSFCFIDHSSVKVVARAAFETYLVFFFIFAGSDLSRCEFRHKIWRYGGLADRQRPHPVNPEARKVQAADKAEMDRLKPEIEASPHLGAYGRDAVKKILRGEWRGGDSWAGLAGRAGFHESYFRDVYGYLCGYSHASYISAMQVGQARSLDEQRKLAKACIGLGLVLMAHFARAYTDLFVDSKRILDADGQAKASVDRWCFSAEDWEKMTAKKSSS